MALPLARDVRGAPWRATRGAPPRQRACSPLSLLKGPSPGKGDPGSQQKLLRRGGSRGTDERREERVNPRRPWFELLCLLPP